MKKTLSLGFFALSLAILPLSVSAQTITAPAVVKEKITTHAESLKDMRERVMVRKNIERVVTGKVMSINGSTLTISSKKGTYTVDATNAKIVRRYGSKTTLADIKVDDEVMVNGTVASRTSTTINAKMIRDNALHLRTSAFEGTLSNLSATGFTLTSKNGETKTIMLTASTTFTKAGEKISATDLLAGAKVVVRASWDRKDGPLTAQSVRVIIRTVHVSGTISAINSSSLTVTGKDTTSTTIVDVSKAVFMVRKNSTTTLSTFKTGDHVEIRATQDTATSPIMAVVVRNLTATSSLR